MTSRSDAELLRDYVQSGSEESFTLLVHRYVGPVFAVAQRQVGGDRHLAEDVTQTVFSALATKAPTLMARPTLGGWLYRTTHFAARDVVRKERRRRQREARTMHETFAENSPEWERIRPTLDDVMAELNHRDRDAVWLRFFEQRPFAEIAETMRVTENAARMRTERALEKLRIALRRRGVESTSGALGLALAQQAVVAVPSELSSAIASTALASGSGGAAFFGTLLAMSKTKIGLAAIVAIGTTITVTRELHASRSTNAELLALRQQVSESANLRAENRELAEQLATLGGQPGTAEELPRLRARIAQLKSRPDGVVDSELRPLSAYGRAGWNTPLAAYETQIWARANHQMDEFAKGLGWSPQARAKLDEFFATLPQEVREKFGTIDAIIAPSASNWGPDGEPVALQVVGVESHGSKAMVLGWARYASGREGKANILFQQGDDGWKLVATDSMADAVLSRIDPETGTIQPKSAKR